MQSRERLIPVLDSDEVAREATALTHGFRRIARLQYLKPLPTVLRSLGLEQTSEGPGFLKSLPARLFPRVGDTKVSSVFSGSVDGVPVAIAEVEVRDQNGDTSEMIFEGMVLRVGLPVPMQDFLCSTQSSQERWR